MVKKISKSNPGIRDIMVCSINEIPAPLQLFSPDGTYPNKGQGWKDEVLYQIWNIPPLSNPAAGLSICQWARRTIGQYQYWYHEQVFLGIPGNIHNWKCTMTKSPLFRITGSACIILLAIALILIPASAINLDPAGSSSAQLPLPTGTPFLSTALQPANRGSGSSSGSSAIIISRLPPFR